MGPAQLRPQLRRHVRRARWAVLVFTAGMLWAPATAAEVDEQAPFLGSKVYLQISPEGQDDLEALFQALEDSVAADEPQTAPVVIVLHGPEALPFIRHNYLQHRDIVDRAAKLQAFDRIELRMCETWMRRNGFDDDDLLPFVTTVPLAPAEVERLERDGYVRFGGTAERSELL